jgi:hypothetical protein
MWFVVAATFLAGVVSLGNVGPLVTAGVGVLMIATAVVLSLLGWRCLRGSRWVDAVALAVAAGNVMVTMVDQAGALDLAYLLFSLVLLGSLLSALVLQRRLMNPERGQERVG